VNLDLIIWEFIYLEVEYVRKYIINDCPLEKYLKFSDAFRITLIAAGRVICVVSASAK